MRQHYLSSGNSKLGKRISSFSLVAGHYCPGQTAECSKACYAQKSLRVYPSVRRLYDRNAGLSSEQIESQIIKSGSIVRIHVSGDFHSAEYIHAWRRLARRNPNSLFYAYTRSWRIAGLLPSLEALRALPNVQLFASLDGDTGMPPKGWRFAMMGQINGHNAPGSIQCPEQTGRVQTCSDCGICYKNIKTNITLAMH